MVTAAPDVSVSTNLGGWINRVGVFGVDAEPVYGDAGACFAGSRPRASTSSSASPR